MLTIGLTGGIGSGKSTVAKLFQQLGISIIDADQIAKDIVAPNQPALKKITEHFGQEILTTNGELDRKQLREKIFDNAIERKWLEHLLHPIIREKIAEQVKQAKPPYCIIVIPLLVENDIQYIDSVLVIDCDETLQIERAMQRDNTSESQVKKILAAQATRQQRSQRADDIIDNNSDIKQLRKQVIELDKTYRNLAAA